MLASMDAMLAVLLVKNKKSPVGDFLHAWAFDYRREKVMVKGPRIFGIVVGIHTMRRSRLAGAPASAPRRPRPERP